MRQFVFFYSNQENQVHPIGTECNFRKEDYTSISVPAVRDGHETPDRLIHRRAAMADNDIDMGTGATSIPVAPTRSKSLCNCWRRNCQFARRFQSDERSLVDDRRLLLDSLCGPSCDSLSC